MILRINREDKDMKRKKMFLIVLLLVLLIILPVVVLANKRIITFNEKGKAEIYSVNELDELAKGTEFSLAVPENYSNNKKSEELIEEKRLAESNNSKNMLKDSVDEINDNNSDLDYNIREVESQNKHIEEKFMCVYEKYYGKEEMEKLFENIEEEVTLYTNQNMGQYTFPQKGIVLIQNCLDIINQSESEEEIECVKSMLDIIDLSYIEDESLINELERFGIDTDKAK